MPRKPVTNQLLTKLRGDDVSLLRAIGAVPRLASVVSRAWRLSRRGHETRVEWEKPAGSAGGNWQEGILLGQGLKLGGPDIFSSSGRKVFKGLNIFASGVKGNSIGLWEGKLNASSDLKVYLYEKLFEPERLFAGREIAQLPTVCKVPKDVVFQNTAILIHLQVELPLHTWVLARPIQWFAAKTLRASIVEDLTSTWMNRQYMSLPVPSHLESDRLIELTRLGEELLERDDDLADSRRKVRALIMQSPARPLVDLVMAHDLVVEGFLRQTGTADSFDVTGVREEGTQLLGDDPSLRLIVPNPNLRSFLLYVLEELAEDEGKKELSLKKFASLPIPHDLVKIAAAIREYRSSDPHRAFERAHVQLDHAAGCMLGLSASQTEYIVTQMREESFLKQLRPAYAHRGLREQPYSDHSVRDRYA